MRRSNPVPERRRDGSGRAAGVPRVRPRGPEPRADCVFCRIVAGAAPASRVFEGERVLAFLDINPVRPGHLLVIPKAHRAQLWDMTDAEFAAVYRVLPTLVRALTETFKADAVDLLNLNGPAGGQTVYHVHFHLIPIHRGQSPVRRRGRRIAFEFEQVAPRRATLDRLAERIRKHLDAKLGPPRMRGRAAADPRAPSISRRGL